jgi:hypothetical protein
MPVETAPAVHLFIKASFAEEIEVENMRHTMLAIARAREYMLRLAD